MGRGPAFRKLPEPERDLAIELKRASREGLPVHEPERYPNLLRAGSIEHLLNSDKVRCRDSLNELIQEYIGKLENDDLHDDAPICFGTAIGTRGLRIGKRMEMLAKRHPWRSTKWAERRRDRIISEMAYQIHRDTRLA